MQPRVLALRGGDLPNLRIRNAGSARVWGLAEGSRGLCAPPEEDRVLRVAGDRRPQQRARSGFWDWFIKTIVEDCQLCWSFL